MEPPFKGIKSFHNLLRFIFYDFIMNTHENVTFFNHNCDDYGFLEIMVHMLNFSKAWFSNIKTLTLVR